MKSSSSGTNKWLWQSIRPLAFSPDVLEAPETYDMGNVTAVAAVERNWRRVAVCDTRFMAASRADLQCFLSPSSAVLRDEDEDDSNRSYLNAALSSSTFASL